MLKTLNPNKTHSDRGLGRGSNGFGQILPLVILFVLSALAAYGKDKQYVAAYGENNQQLDGKLEVWLDDNMMVVLRKGLIIAQWLF